ncbi:hypothetical protein [uncultured Lactobacillus sp.]|uniref:hypothetical protein n=1 Tax=uncultured Lactobacillus sp. TaxID=153152 RepID=UPI00262D445B|nr:hypothetical protein [uncultured Lactobacillus sp.]
MRKNKLKCLAAILVAVLGLSVATPTSQVFADSEEKVENPEYNNLSVSSSTDKDANTNTLVISQNNQGTVLPASAYGESKIAPALAGVYFIPGFGEVALTATGIVIAGGVVYGVGSSIYNLVQRAIKNGTAKKKSGTAGEIKKAKDQIPSRLKKSNGNVNTDLFVNKQGKRRGNNRYYKDWHISKDTSGHKGSEWKLYKGKNRIASLAGDGRVVGK